MKTFSLVTNSEIENLNEFKIIKKHLENYDAQTLLRMAGNCIAACDIITILLHQHGIDSVIVECQVVVKFFNGKTENYNFIGYDGIASPNNVDTHVVVITKTERPILIDIGLSHLLPFDHPFIVEEVKQHDELMGEFIIGNHTVTYQYKKNIKLPTLHQKTILDKIKYELGIKRKINFLMYFVIFVLLLGISNLTLNLLLLYFKLIY